LASPALYERFGMQGSLGAPRVVSNSILSIAFWVGPVLVAALISWLAQDRSWLVHFLTWVFGLPLLFVFGPLLVAIISLHVFGVDLFD
jgi:hypothetical protein